MKATLLIALLAISMAYCDLTVYATNGVNWHGQINLKYYNISPFTLEVGKVNALWGNAFVKLILEKDGTVTPYCNDTAAGPVCGGKKEPSPDSIMVAQYPIDFKVDDCVLTVTDITNRIGYFELVCITNPNNGTIPSESLDKVNADLHRNTMIHREYRNARSKN